jgi:hypothetical protein
MQRAVPNSPEGSRATARLRGELDATATRTGLCTPRHRVRAVAVLVSVCALTGALLAASLALGSGLASASLPSEFGSTGSGPGQFIEARAIAVNQVTGNIYMTDRNKRVDEFTAEGMFVRAWGWGVADGKTEALQTCTVTCFAGLAGSGEGQFDLSDAVGIAVDNATENPLDTSVGDVYVLDRSNGRVEKFSSEGQFELAFAVNGYAVAVGPTGNVYVGEEGAVHEYSPEGASLATVSLEEAGLITDLVIGSSGEIFTVGSRLVHEYTESGALLRGFDLEAEARAEAAALGPQGQVFVNQLSPAGGHLVVEFDSTAHKLAIFDRGAEERFGIAFGDATGVLYEVTKFQEGVGTPIQERVRLVTAPPPGPLIGAESVAEIEPTTAVVHTIIDPETGEEASEVHYRVEFGTTTSYGSSAPVPDGTLPGSFDEDPIAVPLTGLTPSTLYHFRVVASNECEPEKGIKTTCTTSGPDGTFTTLPPVLIESISVTDVRSTSATLHAAINPLGSATAYRFSYGPTTACGGDECSVPVPDGDVGSGKAPVDVTPQHLQGLSPGTVYHYRAVAHNALGTVESEQRTFTTQTPGEAGLPDGRAWELVSPSDKHGAAIPPVTDGGHNLLQASGKGDGIAWPATSAIEAQPPGNAEFTQVLSTRTPAGWASLGLEIPHSASTKVPDFMEYPLFSEDLSLGLLQPFGSFEPSLSPEASEQTPYLRTNYVGGDHNRRCAESCFHPLVTGCPAEGNPCPAPVKEHEDVPPGTVFAPEPGGECPAVVCGPLFPVATPDLSHVILESNVALTKTAIPEGGLYEWARGKLTLVSVLPPNEEGEEEPASGHPLVGFKYIVTAHAISNDGSRVFWEAGDGLGSPLYMRDIPRQETLQLGSAPFEGANADGSRVFFAGKECEVKVSAVTGKLECTDVGEPYGRLLGTSEDGSWVYYEKEGSLYVRHAGVTKLIAAKVGGLRVLGSPVETGSAEHHWRVSPNGDWLAFMSDSALTGYDNRDAASGVPDEEVFLYQAGTNRLVCASCAPTGARPHGARAVVGEGGWPPGTWLAASIPGWMAYTNTIALYQPRYLSNDGRLFFDSSDGVVPKDVNGQQDVYEFEPEAVPAGAHACTHGTTSGSVVFVPSAGGCVGLVSSGESPEESMFVDASETGGDVFFLSTAALSPLAVDGTLSLFDAHECTAGSPCLPPERAQPRSCDTEASCKASQTPQPTIFGASGSATFSGLGNPPPPPPAAPGHRTETRAQKLAKALKLCRRDRSKKRRAACERHARKRYGAARGRRSTRPSRRGR